MVKVAVTPMQANWFQSTAKSISWWISLVKFIKLDQHNGKKTRSWLSSKVSMRERKKIWSVKRPEYHVCVKTCSYPAKAKYFLWCLSLITGASNGEGATGMHDLSRSNFVLFSCSFWWKLGKIIGWHPNLYGWRASSAESWICHCLFFWSFFAFTPVFVLVWIDPYAFTNSEHEHKVLSEVWVNHYW